ncbi:hypothetical protein LCGC14_1459160 [marine sediment metagenome]|uniref:Uncharacterized protein n=1 Tax=marine sediment metagenome TaxID=412755 RepID=A0A0F9K1N3_9ZZZZ
MQRPKAIYPPRTIRPILNCTFGYESNFSGDSLCAHPDSNTMFCRSITCPIRKEEEKANGFNS